MPWKKMLLRSDEVFAHVNDAGELVADGGRVEIRYRPDATRLYHAALRNLSPSSDARVYPHEHCAAIDDVPATPPPPKSPGASSKRTTKPAASGDAHPTVSTDKVIAYADGACTGNPGPAGLGLVVLDGAHRVERSEYLGHGTNNIAELTAIRRALEAVPDATRAMSIHTDSQYSIGVLSKGWKPKKNQELIGEIKALLSNRRNVSLHYVPGHAGVPLNERADELARDAVRTRSTVETVHGAKTGHAVPIAPAEEYAESSPPPAAPAPRARSTAKSAKSPGTSARPTRSGR